MEEEKFISGYCRQLDASRMVEVVAENGEISEVDCCYGNCVYQGSCLIAKEIDGMKSQEFGVWSLKCGVRSDSPIQQ